MRAPLILAGGVVVAETVLRHALAGRLGMALLHAMGGHEDSVPWLVLGVAWLAVRPLALACGAALVGWAVGRIVTFRAPDGQDS